jgi:Ser/Thr protein kinase RdoA (MazF antagonist)
VAWLDALNRDTRLEVVNPIRTAGGSLIVDEFDEAIDKERACVLFSWVPGRPMADGSGTFAYRLLGAMLASLQEHGSHWSAPPHVEMRRWDRIFYYQEFDPVIIENSRYSHLFDAQRVATISKAVDLAQRVIDDSYGVSKPQVVHGDLHEWNVHLVGSRLYAFDFEDVMQALPAQDVAISLYSSRNSEIRNQIRTAFRRGYESVRSWPVIDERQLDGFHAARQIMLMNYAGRTLRVEEAEEYIDHVMPWLHRYVSRYG